MSNAQLLNYYPKYEYLDSALSVTGKKELNLYVDLKGCTTSLYQEWAIRTIADQSTGVQVCDQSIFASILEFIAFHKVYARKRNIKLRVYIFMESGSSSYHRDIHSEYKKNRQSNFFGLDQTTMDTFFNVVKRNFHVAEKICNKLPDVYFIHLTALEADFIPHYLMNNVLSREAVDNSLNLIYSLDKDMLQCLTSENIAQYFRSYKKSTIIFNSDIVKHYFKKDDGIVIDPIWIPLILGIDGDASDNFKGVRGISLTTIYKHWGDIVKSVNTMNDVYKNIQQKTTIFQDKTIQTKTMVSLYESEDVIVRNIKLSSYHLLIEHMINGYPTHMIDCKNHIDLILEKKIVIDQAFILKKAFEINGLLDVVTEQIIFNLF